MAHDVEWTESALAGLQEAVEGSKYRLIYRTSTTNVIITAFVHTARSLGVLVEDQKS